MPKQKAVKEFKKPERVGQYYLVNHEKLDRAINGFIARDGQLAGGVGANASEETKLAAYDKLGGLVLDADGNKLETGSFYDFRARKPREVVEPKVAPELKTKNSEEEAGDAEDKPTKKKRKVRSPADLKDAEGEEDEE